jgi:type II secretory pathway component GspD/PulD (secretin)
VWSKESDHAKIKEAVDTLNEADPDMKLETYSLKNIYEYNARTVLQALVREQGLDIKLYFDTYSKQLVVQAKPADQKTIAEVLEKLRTEDRDLAVFTLETVDPVTAQTAVYTLFYDEPYATAPGVEIDQNTNMIFVQGTKDQISRVRKMLIEMGENIREPNQAVPHQPPAGGSNVRVLQLRGGSEETIRELEKLWKQTQPNKLQVIKEGESPTGLYSLSDEVRRESEGSDSPQSLPAAVYMILNEDGTITVSSQDKSALDQLELLLKRIDSGVVFEGRDYTIYSVRNISADVVAMKLQLILRSRIMAGQQMPPVQRGQSFTNPIPLTLTPDLTTNTIYVRGPKVDRTEVAKLIALLDVSELPGERMVRRPIKVPIQNTQASRVYSQVMNVYQQKMMMTRLPGGVYPRMIVDSLTNSLEIIAPEPLATELKEYAEDIDRRVVEEPGRKIHVIQLGVKSSVIENAIQRIRHSSGGGIPPSRW